MPSPIPPALREFAETPDRWTRVVPGQVDRVDGGGFLLLRGPWWANVTDVRVAPNRVDELVREVRALVGGRRTIWRLGPSTEPRDLEERLRALGFGTPTDGVDELVALATTTAPASGEAEVRRVDSLEGFATAVRLRWEAFETPADRRAEEERLLPETFAALQRSDALVEFVALADGRPASTAACVVSDRGLLLVGGATLPSARGRGLYRALVRARWDEAVRRGTPGLVVQANPATSAPVLLRLGFAEVCRLRQLEAPRGDPPRPVDGA